MKCAAQTCYNNTANRPYIYFFRFPYNKQLADIWAKKAGREDLMSRSLKSLSKFALCEEHFEDEFFTKGPNQRFKLKYNVQPIPTIFNNKSHMLFDDTHEERDMIISRESDFGKISYSENIFSSNLVVSAKIDQILLKDYCIICKIQLPLSDLIPVNDYYKEMLDICLPGQYKNDNFPHMICSSCVDKLKTCCDSLNFCDANSVTSADTVISSESLNSLVDNNNLRNCVDNNVFKSNEQGKTKIKYQCLKCYNVFNDGKEVTEHYFASHPSEEYNQNVYRVVKVRLLNGKNETINKETIAEKTHKNSEVVKENGIKKVVVIKILEKKRVISNEATNNNEISQEENTANTKRIKPYSEIVHQRTEKTKIQTVAKREISAPSMRYECLLCHSTHHTTKEALMKHNRLYHSDNTDGKIYCRILKPRQFRQDIKCLVCPNTYKSIEKYRQHMRKHVSFKCDECEATFDFIYKLYRHKKEHLEINETCSTEEDMLNQGEESTDKSVSDAFLCDICGKMFIKYQYLYKHQITHTDIFTHECNVCGKRLKSRTGLRHHIEKHISGGRNYICHCGKYFNTKAELKQHYITHTAKQHVCDICGKRFRKLQTLIAHRERLHVAEIKFQKCLVCQQVFDCKVALKHHMYEHKKIKLYVCHVCGKTYADNYQFQIHMCTHTNYCDIYPYHCDICTKKFRQLSTLNNHKRSHLGDRYSCPVCSKTFAQRSKMIQHQKIHETIPKDKQFCCPICGKAFTCKASMKQHRKTHENIDVDITEQISDDIDFDLYDENIISDDYLNFLNANSEENLTFETMLINDL